jgi:hypothetical protein
LDTAGRIGLLPGFRWIAGRSFLQTLAICLLITPVGHCVVGLVFESRWVPLAPSRQFVSFFPGDVFIAIMMAGLLTLAKELPQSRRFFNSTWFHAAVLTFTVCAAVCLTWSEWSNGFYPTRAIFSWTKIYHNLLLYGGYGYVVITTLTALVVGDRSRRFFLFLLPGVVWVGLVVMDNTLPADVARSKAEHAHVADWQPIWETWSIRFDGF